MHIYLSIYLCLYQVSPNSTVFQNSKSTRLLRSESIGKSSIYAFIHLSKPYLSINLSIYIFISDLYRVNPKSTVCQKHHIHAFPTIPHIYLYIHTYIHIYLSIYIYLYPACGRRRLPRRRLAHRRESPGLTELGLTRVTTNSIHTRTTLRMKTPFTQ